jgi:arabinofuranan 3-O-arabinosyltransferase
MARLSRSRAETIALTLAAFALALIQRPGAASSDTKLDLHVDPLGFLAGVTSTWSPTGSLGQVQGGQYSGYAWPMGPWFALGRLLDLPPWLVHRLWLGALLAVAACGVAALARVLGGPRRPLLPVAAAAVAVLNPYVVILAGRTSVTLLAYAAMPWLLLAVHRGLRAPRSWWWPAAFALLLASAGGGVNVAVIAFVALAPAALAVYEVAIGHAGRRALAGFGLRTAACVAVTSAWWVAPLAVQVLYGTDFLRFTEQPGTIWTTTSAPEALRLMGYWTSYIGVGYTGVTRPFQADAGVYLFHPAVVLATLALPALAVAGLLWTRRWAYGPFAWGLLLGGVLLVTVGFPDGTPLRRAATFAYNHVSAVQFLRTSFKAAPLIALALALLTGAAADELWRRARGAPARAAVAGGLAAVLALCAWPLVRGQALDSQLTWRTIPAAWQDAAAGLDRDLAPNTRAIVLPGEMFASYRWGGTYDAVLPALTGRPVAARAIVPYGDLHGADLLMATDALVQQGRLLPGQLPPLLRLLGAGAVVTGADTDRARSGAIGPAEAGRRIASALGPPDRAYGPVRRVRAQAGTLDAPARLPQVARRDIDAGGSGIVRLRAAAGPLVVDGSAAGLAGLAALGGLDPGRAVLYAGDRDPAELRAAAEAGAELVVSDSNRRRTLATSKARHGEGPTLAADDPISPDAAVIDPFAARGTAAQTVAVRGGVRRLLAPTSPGSTQLPEHRAFAAVDGDKATAWLADSRLDGARHWIELGFREPRDVDAIDLLPHRDRRGATVAVEIAGRRIALRAGWNHLRLGLRGVRMLRIRIAEVRRTGGARGAAGGIAELRVPGLHVTESLRPPRLLEDTLRGADLSRSALSYVFERTTAADPLRRSPAAGTPQAYLARDAQDPETQLDRRFAPPAARRYAVDGWATVAPDAPDTAVDALAGTAGRDGFLSSGRFEGRPDRRASRAFDGDPATGWIGLWLPGRPAWVAWETPRPRVVRRLVLRAPATTMRRPTRVRLGWDGGTTPALRVGADGAVVLPRAVRGRAFRLEILAAAFPPGTPGRVRQRRAVGIAEIAGAGVRARARPASRPVAAACGALTALVGGRSVPLRPTGGTAALEAGAPLRVRGCGPPLALGAEPLRLVTRSPLMRPLLLRLRSPAPAAPATATAAGPAGRVLDSGRLGRSAVDGVRVAVDRPAWLVLAEGYDRGWRAWCDGRSLGAPRVVDGYANGWRVAPGCRAVRFAFAPDRAARWIALVSGAACLGALALLLLRRRPEAAAAVAADLDPAAADAPARMPWRRAGVVAIPAGLALGFCFGARYTPVFAAIVWLVLRRGVGARPLLAAAAVLLGIVVPALYLVLQPPDHGGYAFEYAGELIAAHWVAVLALVALLAAYARTLTGVLSIGAWVRGSRGGAWASGTRRLRRRSGRSRT